MAAAAVGRAAAPAPVVVPLGSAGQALQAPARVAVDAAGSLYVTDPGQGRVTVYDAFGRLRATRDGFAGPLGIAVDGQGRIYLAEQLAGSVSVFDAGWNLLYQLGAGRGEFRSPGYIALDGSNTVYVSDSGANAVKVYAGAAQVNQFGTPGSGAGAFDFPAGICVSPAGELFVVDQNNDHVQVFDLQGTYRRAYVFRLGMLARPSGRKQGATLDAAGRLYVADAFQGTVRVLDLATGSALGTIGAFGAGAGRLSAPAGLAVDRFNRLLVASVNNARVERFGLDAFLHLTCTPAADAVAAGSDFVLSALAGGGGPVSYQWSKDGTALAGATNGSLTIAGASGDDSGRYAVVCARPAGTLASPALDLSVLTPPVIVSGPQGQSVLRGADVVMSVSATGPALTYQWSCGGRAVAGATASVLELPGVQTWQAGNYAVEVRNAVGRVLSAPATLAVHVPPAVMQLLACSVQPDQSVHLTLNVDPGFVFALEVSTNLFQWEPGYRFINDAGLVDLLDSDAASYPQRFYRLRWDP